MKQKFFTALALCMALIGSVQAQTTIPIVWGYSVASWQGAMAREIVQEANSIQTKFVFVLENKPGAGGAVSSNHVLSSKTPMILANSDSFFTRPLMFTEGWYDINAFVPLAVYCRDQPIALLSKNLSSLRDLSGSRNFTIGINPGSAPQLVLNEFIRQRPNVSFTEVYYKTTHETMLGVLGDHVDASVSFLNRGQDERIKPIAITGTRNIGSFRTFQSQGIAGFEKFSITYYLLVSKTLDVGLTNELSAILSRAIQGARVQEACAADFGQPANSTGDQAQKIFNERRDFFATAVARLPKKP